MILKQVKIVGVIAFALSMALQTVNAATLVATIYGAYDANGVGVLPSSVLSDPNTSNVYGNSNTYDTPSLFFVNPTSYVITNAQLVLAVNTTVNGGQQTLNEGKTQTASIGSLNANGVTQIAWGSSGPLFSNDYDDVYSSNYGNGLAGNAGVGTSTGNCTLNASHPEWFNFCAPVGNFEVTFTGTLSGTGALNGQSVAAVFGEYNVNGDYTGWEGLDPYGWSENALYDVHTGSVSGVLANIYLGTPNTVPTSPNGPIVSATVPVPATLFLIGMGLVGLVSRKRNTYF